MDNRKTHGSRVVLGSEGGNRMYSEKKELLMEVFEKISKEKERVSSLDVHFGMQKAMGIVLDMVENLGEVEDMRQAEPEAPHPDTFKGRPIVESYTEEEFPYPPEPKNPGDGVF